METVQTGGPEPQWATLTIAGRSFRVDLAHPHDLAISVDFDGGGPRWFDAPRSRSEPLASGSFVGQVRRGGSCNCSAISFTPHCDGTHTESAGHITRESFDVRRVVPDRLLPALLVSVTPTPASAAGSANGEGSRPP